MLERRKSERRKVQLNMNDYDVVQIKEKGCGDDDFICDFAGCPATTYPCSVCVFPEMDYLIFKKKLKEK
jgi:hypothetical protein